MRAPAATTADAAARKVAPVVTTSSTTTMSIPANEVRERIADASSIRREAAVFPTCLTETDHCNGVATGAPASIAAARANRKP